MMSRIVALNPSSASPATPEGIGMRLPGLEGHTVAFLSNNKPNAVSLLEGVATELEIRFGVRTIHFSKEVPSLQAPDKLLGDCAEAAHAVVLAAFD